MRVLHVALPRDLSFSVKPWRGDLFCGLQVGGHGFGQIDLNLHFWRWLLDDEETERVGRLLDLQHQDSAYNAELIAQCANILSDTRIPQACIDPRGLSLHSALQRSSTSLLAWVCAPEVRRFWSPWLLDVASRLLEAEVLSFSVGSSGELALAAVLADHMRRVNPLVHTCLTQHRYENFSLAQRLPRLVQEGELLRMFDSVVLREDHSAAALLGLCKALQDGELQALQGIAVRVDDEARIFAPREQAELQYSANIDETHERAIAAYLQSVGAPVDRILMLEVLVRNDCHYGRCTFCVQNAGYARRQQYKHASELDRSLGLVRHLALRHGVRHFSFIDQAVHPYLLRTLCTALADHAPRLRWCVRMLSDCCNLSDEFLARMAAAGCGEVLLGLESTDPATLQAMGKPHRFHGAKAHDWMQRCAHFGIDVTLSSIHGYPSEAPADYEAGTGAFLAECVAQHNNVSIVRNRFLLFEGSEMATRPAGFGICGLQRTGGDLESVLDYVDVHGRSSRDPEPAGPSLLESTVQQLHYSSIGLLHRWRTGHWLPDELGPAAGAPQTLRDTLVLGCNGYLGRNLATRLAPQSLLLSSRGASNQTGVDAPYFSQDLATGRARLSALSPAVVWLCSRPFSDDLETHVLFLRHIQVLLANWAASGVLRRLVYFSTQLVAATPQGEARVDGQSALAPESVYDCAKAQLELFVSYLARAHGLSVDVVRLPLLWGGEPTAADGERQLLHRWRRQLTAGQRWHFSPGDEDYGNSWVDVGDLVDALMPDPGPGLRVRSASSGDFTYAGLQNAWGGAIQLGGELHLPRSRFFLQDELQLPRRGLDAGDGHPAPVQTAYMPRISPCSN